MKKRLKEFILFGFIGAAMSALSLFLYYVLNERAGIHYILSNAISYSVAVGISYVLNATLTFREATPTGSNHAKKLVKYFGMKLAFLGLDSGCLYLLVDLLHQGRYLSKIITTVVLTAFSYITTRIIITK